MKHIWNSVQHLLRAQQMLTTIIIINIMIILFAALLVARVETP